MALTIDLGAGLRPPPSPERGTPDGRFMFEKKLGEGAEGLVYLAVPTRRKGEASSTYPSLPVAVKVVSGSRAYERCRTSRGLWPKLVHPNVVFPRESWWDDENGRCFVQMELCQTDLLDLVCDEGALEDERGSVFAGHLASALVHLHSQGIAHQDVKLENIFVSKDGVAKLGDLGSVVQILPNAIQEDGSGGADPNGSFATYAASSTSSATFVGSVMYAPPEISDSSSGNSGNSSSWSTRTRPCQRQDPFAADMWAFGVSLWSAMAGCHPWEMACVKRSKEFQEFVREGAAATLPRSFSPGLRSLLARLLALDPRERPTAAEVLACPWVSAPPTTPPAFSSGRPGMSLPSWPSCEDLSSEQQKLQHEHTRQQRQQQQQQQQRQQHQQQQQLLRQQQQQQQQQRQQQQQEPAPVTPTGTEDSASLLHQGPDSSIDAEATATAAADAAAPAACGDGFGCCPEQEGLFLDAAGAAAAAAAAAAEVVVAAPEFTAIQPSPIRSRHRRSKKRKAACGDGTGQAATASPSARDRAIGFVLDQHTEQEGDDDAFSAEISALGSILDGSISRGGGERPTKIARVSPSPLTLPTVTMGRPGTQAAAEPHEDGAVLSEFSGLGSQRALVDFLQHPPPILPRMRQSGARRRAARATTARRPVPGSPRAAAAAGGSIWGWGRFAGGAAEGLRCSIFGGVKGGASAASGATATTAPAPATAVAGADSFATIAFSPGERAPTE